MVSSFKAYITETKFGISHDFCKSFLRVDKKLTKFNPTLKFSGKTI
jgi:hypothetical protein